MCEETSTSAYQNTFGHVIPYSELARFILRYTNGFDTFIDLACGQGDLLAELETLTTMDLVGCDLSTDAILVAKKKCTAELYQIDILDSLSLNQLTCNRGKTVLHLGFCFLNTIDSFRRAKFMHNIISSQSISLFITEVWNNNHQRKLLENTTLQNFHNGIEVISSYKRIHSDEVELSLLFNGFHSVSKRMYQFDSQELAETLQKAFKHVAVVDASYRGIGTHDVILSAKHNFCS